MATYVDQAHYGWPREELPHQDDSEEVSASKMLDHGSISFGRFAYESLSWEKRSVFTYNKCQEELERFKSPGLVAKKKAYFEEYYKRIRAMKALQESQQTEITLEYGGDSSISSQTGEEDETVVQLEDVGGGVAEDVDVHPEEVPNAVCSETIEVPVEHSDPEILMPDSGSSVNYIEECEHADTSICPDETELLDIDISVHDSLAQCIEETKEHDLNNRDDKGVSRGSSVSVTNMAPDVASEESPLCLGNSKEGDIELKPAHINVPRKDLTAGRKYKDSVSVPKEPLGCARNGSKTEDKAKPNHKKPSHGCERPIQRTCVKSGNSVDSTKATADEVSGNNKSSIVASTRPRREVQSNVTTPRPFSLATDRRAAASTGSSEGTLKLLSKSLNQRPSAAVKWKNAVIVPGPSKRTIINSSSTKSRGLQNKRAHEEEKKPVTLEKQSTIINSSSTKSRGLQNKSYICRAHEEEKKPVTLEKQSTIINSSSTKSRGLQNKRAHEEEKKHVTLEKQSTSQKARYVCVNGPVKERSLNLHRNKLSSNSGTDIRLNVGFRNDGREEGRRSSARVTELCRPDAKLFTPPATQIKIDTKVFTPLAAKTKIDTKASTTPAAKLRTETKKMGQSRMSNSSLPSGRRPRCGDESLDGKKPRGLLVNRPKEHPELSQEKPRWR